MQLLKAIFKMYAAGTASNLSGGTEINGTQFGRFARDVGLSTGLNPLNGERNGLAALPSVQVDLVYQKAIADEIHSRNAAWQHVQGAQADAAEGVKRESLATEAVRPDKETSEMGCREFVGALVRLAWLQLPKLGGVGERVTRFLNGAVFPALVSRLQIDDPMGEQLQRRRVRAILDHHDRDLRSIFRSYAAADMDIDAQDAMDSVNLAELMYMCKEGRLLDAALTVSKVAAIFSQVNAAEEDEGGDDDESELVYDEWVQVIARICDAKIPEDKRGGECFEYTLQSWMQLVFVPCFKQLLKDKAKGNAAKTLN